MGFVRSAGAPGLKTRIPEPAGPVRRPPWIRFGISKPKYPSPAPSQALPGLKTRIPEPAGPFRRPLWIRLGVSKPKYPSLAPSQALPGLKTRIPEPAGPFRCRLLGLQVRSRSAQHSVLSRTAASRSPLQPFGSACPSTRSGCAVPCGPSRSQARVPSLPGPVNPALGAPDEH